MHIKQLLKEIFPFDYQGGGYYRLKGVPKNTPAPIIHGEQVPVVILTEILKNYTLTPKNENQK